MASRSRVRPSVQETALYNGPSGRGFLLSCRLCKDLQISKVPEHKGTMENHTVRVRAPAMDEPDCVIESQAWPDMGILTFSASTN